MSQNDYVIANQTAPNFRADLNLALQALASTSSGATAPATTYANMLWYDTAANTLYMRSEADDAWITLGTLDQSLNTFTPAGIATQSTAVWEAGTDTTESLISAAKVSAAVSSLVPTGTSAYDIQVFTASGTWTKPSNTEADDIIEIWCVGGGGSGARGSSEAASSGGGGGAGPIVRDKLSKAKATEAVVVAAGGAGTATLGSNGGTSTFGTSGDAVAGVAPLYIQARGGSRAEASSGGPGGTYAITRSDTLQFHSDDLFGGGDGGSSGIIGSSSVFGAGGGGGADVFNGTYGGTSARAGSGGQGTDTASGDNISEFEIDGFFPGGGGGGVHTGITGDTIAGSGADGIVVVRCYRAEAR